jgi:hypothetical protein
VKKFPFPRSSLALAAALLFAAGGAALSLDVYTSVAGDYSVNFPAPPEENTQSTDNYRIVSHAVRADEVIYIVAHGDFVVPPPVELELDANIDNYVKELNAQVLSRGTLAFARGDKPLPAKQFTYDGERLSGRGIVVMDGKSSYIVAATALKPNNREAAVNAFVNSFTLVPAK